MDWFSPLIKGGGIGIDGLGGAWCQHCKAYSLWIKDEMVYPLQIAAVQAHPDMPSDLKSDFEEARQILGKSPRGAAALLRLVIQKLMKELGQEGKDINKDIGELVKLGLPVRIQQALDAVRVIGNESVHPGMMNLQDTPEIADVLFELVNLIVDNQIAEPKRVNEIYNKLPANKLAGIKARDS